MELSDYQKDILREIGNIGAGRAAATLSKFVHQEVSMSLPHLETLTSFDETFAKVLENFDVKDEEFTMVHCVIGENNDYFLFSLIPKKSCEILIELSLEGDDIQTLSKNSPTIIKSLLKEVGSILLISYVDALNKFIHLNHIPYPSDIEIGSVEELLNKYQDFIRERGIVDDEMFFLFINLSIWVLNRDIRAYIGLIPTNETLELFFKNLQN
jgi:chemotaxis protein CheC